MTTLHKTPLEMFYHWEKTTPGKNYLNQPVNGTWQSLSWSEFGGRVRRVASFLLAQNYPAGSRIAIYSKNSADWIIADVAIMLASHVSVPLFVGQAEENLLYILDQSESRLVFIGKTDGADKIYDQLPAGLKKVALLGGDPNRCDTTIATLLAEFEPYNENPLPGRDQLFTLVYTSGTTGKPKGVMHTFNSPATVVHYFLTALRAGSNERLISYLPLSHIAERVFVEMDSLYGGMSVYFNDSLETFIDDIQYCQPTLFLSVPRLWMKFRERIESRLSPRLLKMLLKIPLVGNRLRSKIKRQLGLSQCSINLSGSAPLAPELQRWFANLGIDIRSAYATTESFCYGCFDLGESPCIGTVGKPLAGGDVTISEDGEVLYKADCIMSGYYLLPDKTAETLKNDYYHTSDAGVWDDNGNLIITGRLSDVFKTSKGKFVQPSGLEHALAECKLFAQLCVIGQGFSQPVALANLSAAGTPDKPAIENQIAGFLKTLNQALPHHEQIEQVFITRDEWTAENKLLTPTLKLKRREIEARYRPWVETRLETGMVVWEQ